MLPAVLRQHVGAETGGRARQGATAVSPGTTKPEEREAVGPFTSLLIIDTMPRVRGLRMGNDGNAYLGDWG
jgi:hypothetical protein